MKITILLLFVLTALSAQYTRVTICASGCTYTNDANGLQTAVNDAATSQNGVCAPYLIEIDPAQVLDLAGNTITLAAKTCGQYVRIRSMRMIDLPRDGTRVDTSSSALVRIQSTMANVQYFVHFRGPGSKTRYWAFEGLDLYENSTNGAASLLIELGDTSSSRFSASTDPGRRADHFEVKHCWIHGGIGSLNVSTGIGIDSNNVLIADSVVEDIANDGESHAIAVNHSDGPIDLINNNFDASTITTIVGGAIDPAGLIPTFIHYIGNRYSRKGWYKHLYSSGSPSYPCRAGNIYTDNTVPVDWVCSGGGLGTWTNTGTTGQWPKPAQKNVWEQKTGRGSRLYGNDFSGGWLPTGQSGQTFVLNLVSSTTCCPSDYAAFVQPVEPNSNVRTNPTYAQPWTTLADFSWVANNIHDSIAGWDFSAPENYTTNMVGPCAAGGVSHPPWCLPNSYTNMRMYNNLATGMNDQRDYDGGSIGSGRAYGFVTTENLAAGNVDFRHNTYLTSTATVDSGWMNAQLVNGAGSEFGYANVRDSIMPRSRNSYDQCSWNAQLTANGVADLRGNTLITGGPWGNNPFTTGANCVGDWPLGTQSAANNAAAVDGSFRVQAAFQGTATDGRDPGADIAHVNYATAGAVSGAYNAALEYKLRSAMPTRTGANVYFTANSDNACTWELSTNPDSYAAPIAVSSQTRNGRDGIATWTGNLAAGTAYFARSNCDGLKLEYDVSGRRFMFITRLADGLPPLPPPTADFSISLSPSSVTFPSTGGTDVYTVTITRVGGFTDAVTLSTSGLPSGSTGSFSPNPTTGTSSTLTATVSGGTAAGSYLFTGIGASPSLTRTATANLIKQVGTPPAQVTINVNAGTTYQTMQGFGTTERVFDDPHLFNNCCNPANGYGSATVMSMADQDAILDLLYTNLKLTWVRPANEQGVEVANDGVFNFAWKRNDAHVDYVQRAISRGVTGYFMSPVFRESWMGVSTASDVVSYSDWLYAIINRWVALGLSPPYQSIANEPSYNRNPMPDWFVREVIKNLGPRLRAEGVGTMFVVPDDINPGYTASVAATVLGDAAARQYVGAIATHLYGGKDLTGVTQIGVQYGLPVWMTEYSRNDDNYTALDYAEKVIHAMIANFNVSMHLYMWGSFGQWETDKTVLITLNNSGSTYLGYTVNQMYYVTGQYSKYIPNGSIRVGATSDQSSIQVTAYKNGSAPVIVAINNTDSSYTTNIVLTGFNSTTVLRRERTSNAGENGAALSSLAINSGTFVETLPARSITTYF